MELTLDQALKKGIEAQRAGKTQEAASFYSAILKAHPTHPDANHNMGLLAVGMSKIQEALPLFNKALEAKPSEVQFWLSYIDALINLDRIVDAKGVFDQAKSNGATGEAIAQLEKWFSNKSINEINIQEAPTDQLQDIIHLHTKGQFQKALSECSEMLERFPNSVALHNIVGACNSGLMQFGVAINSYKQALKIKPDSAQTYYHMGVALKDSGNLDACIESYKQAIKIKPDYALAHNNMGIALNDKNDPDSAIESYKQAIKIRPDYAEAYNNMGVALNNKGEPKIAIDSFKQALRIKSDLADAYYNMGIALKANGDLDAAIKSYQQAIKIEPDYDDAYYGIGNILCKVHFFEEIPNLQETITSLLNGRAFVHPRDILPASISLLKFEPAVKELLKENSVSELKQSLKRLISNLSELPLLLKLMSVCPLTDLALENALTDIRSALLLSVYQISNSPEVFCFQSALALQCFTNEYIYSQTNEDTKSLKALEIAVEQSLSNGQQPSPQSVLCLASYKALYHYKWSGLLNVTPDIEEVITRQILEPNQESRLKSDMPVLQEITNKVSSKVREQYEESPYPRWVSLRLRLTPQPISEIGKELRLKLLNKVVNDVESPRVLIAGCGTGQNSIMTASRFKNAQVLAVDLSLSSLAYAKGKTEELGLQNIDYMQADILDLSKLDREFDIIESTGVLHHMDDPLSGWRVLTDCLKPNGLMKIGLYSELARQHIVKMREEINQSGIGSNDLAMKSFRSAVVTSQEKHHKSILSSPDFYSLSTLRDLLFHVQEHRFTIPQIKKCLDELGLKFCGFEADTIVQDFKLTNTGKDDSYDLDKWASYEESTPLIFGSMYQFWCQKVS